MKKALITGGCGFVGRRYTCELLKRGYQVTVVDDLSTGLDYDEWPAFQHDSIAHSKECVFIYEDVREFFKLATEQYDIVVHLAAVVGGRLKIDNDPIAVATDLSIDAEFFNWIVKTKQKDVLYYSSSAAYPVSLQTKDYSKVLYETDIDLSKIKNPDMSYGWSKLTGEFLAQYVKDINLYIFRPFSGYGEDQDLTYPFPSIMKRIIDEQNPIEVWGTGEQVRDFIYIDDCVKRSLFFVEHKLTGTYNLGTERATSFLDLIKIGIEQYNQKYHKHYNPTIQTHEDKPTGVFFRVGSIDKLTAAMIAANATIDDVRIVELEAGIRKTFEYLEKQKAVVA